MIGRVSIARSNVDSLSVLPVFKQESIEFLKSDRCLLGNAFNASRSSRLNVDMAVDVLVEFWLFTFTRLFLVEFQPLAVHFEFCDRGRNPHGRPVVACRSVLDRLGAEPERTGQNFRRLFLRHDAARENPGRQPGVLFGSVRVE
ncbi:MAG: hypothetical protein A3E01_02780 [Gammaproteobacteria bacterium RIFCSPHIGHO2_12_FULL_63_22]|nr:MAG: hypothetical protein A3E01_02780 [Gammaproteobacteria bacterium RIFCSPHIGHO2_12_FULL_63_22]